MRGEEGLEALSVDGVFQSCVVNGRRRIHQEGKVGSGDSVARDMVSAISKVRFKLVEQLRLVVHSDGEKLLSAVCREESLASVLNVVVILASLVEPEHLVGLFRALRTESVLHGKVLENAVLLVHNLAIVQDQDGQATGAVVGVVLLGFLPFLTSDAIVLKLNATVGK